MTGGRANVTEGVDAGSTTTTLALDQETFWRLCFGRLNGADALVGRTGDPGGAQVTVDGDLELGRRVVGSMAFMA